MGDTMKQVTNPPKTGEVFAIIWYEGEDPKHYDVKWCNEHEMFYIDKGQGWLAVTSDERLFNGVTIFVKG